MDTELKEPIRITKTPAVERDPVFSVDNQQIFFTRFTEGACDIWRAERSDLNQYWWQNSTFKLQKLTADYQIKSDLIVSPDGTRISFTKNRGGLWIMDLEGKNMNQVIKS